MLENVNNQKGKGDLKEGGINQTKARSWPNQKIYKTIQLPTIIDMNFVSNSFENLIKIINTHFENVSMSIVSCTH